MITQNYVKNMANSGIRTCNFWIPNRSVTLHIRIIRDTNDYARHRQNQEKEKDSDYWIEYFPFEYFFLLENKNILYYHERFGESSSRRNREMSHEVYLELPPEKFKLAPHQKWPQTETPRELEKSSSLGGNSIFIA